MNGRMILRVWFIKQKNGEVVRREKFYISSLASSHIHDFNEWYDQHSKAIIINLSNLSKKDSDLQFDGVDALLINTNLRENLTGRSFFRLPTTLATKHAVINVQTNDSCLKYAILSILHYGDVKTHRDRVSSYRKWGEELNFSQVDINNINISKDIP